MDLPKRKRNRMEDYDYSLCGAYFVTICIANRQPVLWTDVGASCARQQNIEYVPFTERLSDMGRTVNNEIQKMNSVYHNVSVGEYCVMPDHIHMIVFISDNNGGRPQVAPTLSRIIQQFKGSVTKQIGYSIWQKSFHDHVIRNEHDYKEICRYIAENPQKYDIYISEI